MKKRILIISIFLACLIVPLSLVIAKNQTADEVFPRLIDFKMEVFREGQLSEKKLLVSMQIWKLDNSFFVSWNYVHIEPLHGRKKIFLNPRHFCTDEGSIKNVSVGKNSFSFRLEHLEGHGLTADIVGKKTEGQDSYSVKANAIDFILGAGLKTTEIWKSTDKAIVLPYREIAWASTTNSNQTEKSSTIDAEQKAASSNKTSTEDAKTIFIGFPKKKVSEGGLDRVVEDLSRKKAANLRCVISKIEDKYYWASRENKEMVKIEGAGAFITFLAVNGSGYVKVIKPEFKKAASLMSKTEESFDYIEHLTIGLRSVNYWGEKER